MVYVYELMENYTEALAMTNKYSNLFKLPGDAKELSAKFHMKLSQFEEAKEIYTELLVDLQRDNWKFLQFYIDCLRENEKSFTNEMAADVNQILTSIDLNRESSIPLRIVHLGKLYVLFLQYEINQSTGTIHFFFIKTGVF